MKIKILSTLFLSLYSCLYLFATEDFFAKLAIVSFELTKQKVTYDAKYYKIKYPMGDVPSDKGVCTDVVIRAYRKLDIDLQKEVHEDMKANFDLYPKIWGLKKTDTNIVLPPAWAFGILCGGYTN